MKKRIKLAVVGSASISREQARMLARAILKSVDEKYVISKLITIDEDPIGKALTLILLFQNQTKLKSYSEARHSTQSQAAELVAGDVLWATTNYILVHNGECSWAQHLGEMLTRVGRKYRLIEIPR